MSTAPIAEAEVEALLAEPMRIDGPVQWAPKSADAWAEATLRVRHRRREVNLTLKITVNLYARGKFSLSLLLDNSHRIRAVDVGSSHENKHTDSNRWIRQPHEHRWTDACHGAWARSVEGFPGELGAAFTAFCERLGIEFAGVWSDPPPVQLGLEDV